MFNPLRSTFEYRDFWGEVNAFIAERLDPILGAGCYVPRWYHAPSNELELQTGPNAYLRYGLGIPAGSFIFGFWHSVQTAGGSSPAFFFQMTDMALNRRFFGNQIPEAYLGSGANNYPWLLDYPYPVVAPGNFLTEFWNPNSSTVRCSMTVGVAEVSPDVMEQVTKGAA